MSDVRFNLPFSIGLGDVPDNLPPEFKSFADTLYNAFQQLLLACHNELGVGQQLQSLWSILGYNQLHRASMGRLYCLTSEVIAYGAAVNLFSNAGVLTARNANATNNTRPAHGFCLVSGGSASGVYTEVVLNRGLVTGFAGLTLGTRYFLSTSNGQVTAAAPAAAGTINQALGLALATDVLLFDFGFHYIQN